MNQEPLVREQPGDGVVLNDSNPWVRYRVGCATARLRLFCFGRTMPAPPRSLLHWQLLWLIGFRHRMLG